MQPENATGGKAPGRAASRNLKSVSKAQHYTTAEIDGTGLGINGDLLPPIFEDPAGRFARVRSALRQAYTLAGTVGARKAQLSALDGLAAIGVIASDYSRGAQ